MLYKNEIYRLYLELIEKKEKTKNDKLTNVFFDICDYRGGCNELNIFIEEGGLRELEDGTDLPDWLWGINMFKTIDAHHITVRIMDPELLRKIIFRLDDWAKNEGYYEFEELFYVERH